MRLKNSDGSLFELAVDGYEFPEITNQAYDSNWLLIRIHVVHPKGEWTDVGATLLTYEMKAIADWFDPIAAGNAVEPNLDFIEPNLSFRLLGQANGKSLAGTSSSNRGRPGQSLTPPGKETS